MDDQELVTKIKTIRAQELRSATETFVEVVFTKDVLNSSVIPLMETYFGPPLKPAGQAPTPEALACANPHGGIRKDQTLYHRKDGRLNTAMFWPWSDGTTVTVKIFKS